MSSDLDLVAYERTWRASLGRLQRAHPSRWSVRGWSSEEVRDALTLRLLEVICGDPAEHARYERPGKEWAIVVMRERLAELRRAHRLDATPTDFEAIDPESRGKSQEEQWLDAEADACRAIAKARAEASLSRPQRRWLSAMRMAANAGAFFRASDELNLSAAARLLGKNRSSAQRAYAELEVTFGRERERAALRDRVR